LLAIRRFLFHALCLLLLGLSLNRFGFNHTQTSSGLCCTREIEPIQEIEPCHRIPSHVEKTNTRLSIRAAPFNAT